MKVWQRKTRGYLLPLTFVASSILFVSCGSKDSTDETTTTTTDKATTTSSLAKSFPGSLALSVFPQTEGTALALAAEEEFDPNAMTIKEKIVEQEKIASGTADSCLPPALNQTIAVPLEEACYEFDQDMIYGTNDTSKTPANFLGTQDGKDAKGEACLVSFTRSQVTKVISIVDQTLGFGMGALCQHKKDNPTAVLPALSASIDLAPALTKLFTDKMTVTSATLERLADVNTYPVYRIIIKAALEQEGITRTVGIIHSPYNDANTEYSGTMYTVMEGVPQFLGGPGANPPPQQEAKYQLMSITYKRAVASGVTALTAELRSAQVAKSLAADAIDSSGVLNLNVGTNIDTVAMTDPSYGQYVGYNQANDAVDGITFVAFSLNPDTNEGTLAYWKNPGGNYYENARGFNISTEKNSDEVLAGCATSGSASVDFSKGISIRRYLNTAEASNSLTLNPKGFWHPFMNSPTSNGTDSKGNYKERNQQSGQITKWYVPLIADATLADTFVTASDGSLITRQCFMYDATAEQYAIDTTEISAAAGYELVDTGVKTNSAKFIALPPAPPVPPQNLAPKFEPVKE